MRHRVDHAAADARAARRRLHRHVHHDGRAAVGVERTGDGGEAEFDQLHGVLLAEDDAGLGEAVVAGAVGLGGTGEERPVAALEPDGHVRYREPAGRTGHQPRERCVRIGVTVGRGCTLGVTAVDAVHATERRRRPAVGRAGGRQHLDVERLDQHPVAVDGEGVEAGGGDHRDGDGDRDGRRGIELVGRWVGDAGDHAGTDDRDVVELDDDGGRVRARPRHHRGVPLDDVRGVDREPTLGRVLRSCGVGREQHRCEHEPG